MSKRVQHLFVKELCSHGQTTLLSHQELKSALKQNPDLLQVILRWKTQSFYRPNPFKPSCHREGRFIPAPLGDNASWC